MKTDFAVLMLVLLLAACFAVAQISPKAQAASPGQQPAAPPSQAGAAQPGATPAPGGATQAQPAQPAQAQPAPGGRRVLQAKSQDEMKAYQDAFAKNDPAEAAAAADAFAAKYPDSQLRATLYMKAMSLYGQANNADKLIELGRKAIAADPTNPVPLVQVASALAETTRATDLDHEERFNEAGKDAQAAIDNIDTGLLIPPDAPADKVAAAKNSILVRSYDTLGIVSLSRKDFTGAEKNLQKATDLSKADPEAVVYLRLSVAQDELKQYPQALDSANKAVQYAPPGSAALNLAKQQQARLQKLIDANSAPGIPAPDRNAAPTAPVSGNQPPPGTPGSRPAPEPQH